VIDSVINNGRIIRPQIGVRYKMITPEMVEELGLSREQGALLVNGDDGSNAIITDSPAAKAGLMEGDIIFEINAVEINQETPLVEVIQKFKPGNRIGLKIQRDHNVLIKILTLREFK
jgi:serine protease Do